MKYSFLLLGAAIFCFSSCSQSSKESSSTDSIQVAADSAGIDSTDEKDTRRPSPEEPVSGIIYEGNLPCADCEGLKTELTMGANFRYALSETYMGKSGSVKTHGYFNQQRAFGGDPNATLFVLMDAKTGNQKYFVQYTGKENEMILLDSKKKVLGGDNPFKLVKK